MEIISMGFFNLIFIKVLVSIILQLAGDSKETSTKDGSLEVAILKKSTDQSIMGNAGMRPNEQY